MTDVMATNGLPTSQMNRHLRVAVIAGAEQAVRVHIARGDDLNARDAVGMTALMLASSRDKPNVCQLLIDAGADPWLADADGHTALDIATRSGALQAWALLSGLMQPRPVVTTAASTGNEQQEQIDFLMFPQSDDAAHAEEDDGFGYWEAEPEPLAPEQDAALEHELVQANRALTDFPTFDDSASWDDSDLLLPDRAALLLRPAAIEAQAEVRLLFLRALREGSVPEELIDEVALQVSGETPDGVAAAIRLALCDMGSECDERCEFTSSWDDFRVHVDAEESADEDYSVSEALAHIEEKLSNRNDPLRAYQREYQRLPLLSAEAEVKLAQDMEAAIANARRALARWPQGIRQLLIDIQAITKGDRTLRSLALPPTEPDELPAESTDSPRTEIGVSCTHGGSTQDDSDDAEATQEDTGVDELTSLTRQANEIESWIASIESKGNAIEERILEMKLARSYLVELLVRVDSTSGQAGEDFQAAITTYLRARDDMVRGNLKLAFSVAKKYLYSNMELADLVQEANLGLLKAVDKFDWHKGFKFSTYATWWIRQQVSRSVADKSHLIRLPVHIYEQAQRTAWAAKDFENAHGRPPTPTELGNELELPTRKTQAHMDMLRDPEQIDEADVDIRMSADSMERFVVKDPEFLFARKEASRVTNEALDSLKIKEKNILCLRFGIGTDDPLTLEDIGQRFEVTRERIRQVEAQAIRKLKHPSRLGLLQTALGKYNGPQASLPSPGADHATKAPKAANLSERDVPQSFEAEIGNEGASTQDDSQSTETAADEKKNRLARAVELASKADVVLEDDRPSGGSVWAYITHPHDAATRALVRELTRVGFELWPGRGYWL